MLPDDGDPFRAGAGHFDGDDFAVLLVLVEEAVLERRVRRAQRQVAHADGQRPAVVRTRRSARSVTAHVTH